jgi:hypothetical protein
MHLGDIDDKGERSCFAAANSARKKWESSTLNAPSA